MNEHHGLRADEVRVGYGDRLVLDGVELAIEPRTITAIVGANGCGKSTLLRTLARLLSPQAGHVVLDGRDIRDLGARELAHQLAILPQAPSAPEGLSVEDLVARGRYPHQGLFRQWSADDERAVEEALTATDLLALRRRLVDELSGGQRQRAWIAMALAQETDLLLLDEPTTFLDLAHQIDVLGLLDELVATHHRTVVLVLHDINQACRYADRIVALVRGRVHAAGAPDVIVDAALMRDVFGVDALVTSDPVAGTPLCLPTTTPRRSRCES